MGIVGTRELPFKDRHISIRFNCIFKVQKQIYYKQSIYISSEVFNNSNIITVIAIIYISSNLHCLKLIHSIRGGEWYLEKRGSRKILAGSQNLKSVFDKSRSLVSAWFVFTFFESRNFLPKSLGLGFLTRISASRRVSDFTIPHP